MKKIRGFGRYFIVRRFYLLNLFTSACQNWNQPLFKLLIKVSLDLLFLNVLLQVIRIFNLVSLNTIHLIEWFISVYLGTFYHFLSLKLGNKSEMPDLILVVAFRPDGKEGSECGLKRHTDESINTNQPRLSISKSCPNSLASALSSSFITSVNCWELLHQTEELRNEFAKLCQHLRTDSWSWFPNFVIDSLIYQGHYSEALLKLQSSRLTSTNHQPLLLKTAGILLSLGNHIVSIPFTINSWTQ